MNSGAPASRAPFDSESAGTIRSARTRSILYSCGWKNRGAYGLPAGFAAALWTCCAASRSSPPARYDAPASASQSRRVISDIAAPHLPGQILGHAPGQRDDRQGWILIGVAG